MTGRRRILVRISRGDLSDICLAAALVHGGNVAQLVRGAALQVTDLGGSSRGPLNARIEFLMTDRELSLVDQKACEANISRSELIRRTAKVKSGEIIGWAARLDRCSEMTEGTMQT